MRTYSTAIIGGAVLGTLLLAGYFLPLPYNPTKPNVTAILQPPSTEHWFGTDISGFDVFSRTVSAAQRDLPLALAGALIALAIGVPLGLLASSKARYSNWIMRGLDVFQAFPLLILAIAIVILTGNQLHNVLIAIAIINVPRFMRLVRAQALSLRESRFIEAAIAIGCSPLRVMFRHLLPNVSGIVFVQSSLAAANAIIVIAALSFLGVGVNPPDPTWGSMIQRGARNISTGQWWTVVFPGIAVIIAVLGFNLIAEGLQDRAET